MAASASANAPNAAIDRDDIAVECCTRWPPDDNRASSHVAAMTISTIGEARARYTRRSAAISVAIGTTLDDGARIKKNHAPRNASHPQRSTRVQPTIVATSSAVNTIAPG